MRLFTADFWVKNTRKKNLNGVIHFKLYLFGDVKRENEMKLNRFFNFKQKHKSNDDKLLTYGIFYNNWHSKYYKNSQIFLIPTKWIFSIIFHLFEAFRITITRKKKKKWSTLTQIVPFRRYQPRERNESVPYKSSNGLILKSS